MATARGSTVELAVNVSPTAVSVASGSTLILSVASGSKVAMAVASGSISAVARESSETAAVAPKTSERRPSTGSATESIILVTTMRLAHISIIAHHRKATQI